MHLTFSTQKMAAFGLIFLVLVSYGFLIIQDSYGAIHGNASNLIDEANKKGPYIGLVIPNLFEMNPLLQSPSFISSNITIDFAGKRFRFGTIYKKQVILVMTGLGMLNAGITTQLLLSLFDIEGVVHYGTAGNANPSLNVGDVTIPQFWSHSALWNWQKFGDGPEDELVLEANGDYTREIGYLKFADYTKEINIVEDGCRQSSYDNLLNNVWFQPEEIFPIDGTPEERQHAFWVAVDSYYFNLTKKLENLELEKCVNSNTCLPVPPKVITVLRGTSASILVANDAYKSFVYAKFEVSAVDMESAAVALVSLQQRVPFIAFRALSGGAAFISVASINSVTAVLEFIRNL